ncbi:MAG: penicillin acylase family protein [Boseongicola sp. SB0673_bin_14]|nr:penicillin acylase family protein [Boseongicola sp. SB0667_bin_21]MYI67762.1 penicillin acylase family protein [Boseongicola sp. SB0673_bin_14]
MVVLLSWLARIAFWLLAFVLSLFLCVWWVLSQSVPDYSVALTVTGIGARVQIVRDVAAVPHVFAETDEDAFFGLGLAHAQDRLWQMTILRRTAQGRLSEIFGSRTLPVDELMRRLDIHALAVASVEAQDAYTRRALDAYAAGVNAWLVQVDAGARGRGAPEFWLFGAGIERWQPGDSIAIGKLMALRLSGHLRDEVLRARLSQVLPKARMRDLFPGTPDDDITAFSEFPELFGAPMARHAAPASQHSLDALHAAEGASNAWAAAPHRSAGGGTLLANDPHLELTAPSIWHLARLELAGGGVIGGMIPGMPVMLTGRSDHVAWGLTHAYADDQDIFLEKLNPEDPKEVLTPDGWKRLESRESVIGVKDSEPVTVTLRWSDNGPVLPGTAFDLESVVPPGHVAALAWTALDAADTSAQSMTRLMQARNVDEALAAGEDFVAPAQNLVVADRREVALKVIGAMPRRSARSRTRGRVPAPGWHAGSRWLGILPYLTNPEVRHPSDGIVGSTNNRTTDRAYPLHVSHRWGDTQRMQRLRHLMESRKVHTRESFVDAQLDAVSVAARTLLPLVARDLWFTGEAAKSGTAGRLRRDALDLLADWNGKMSEHAPEPLIYAAWMQRLQDRLIRDELGPLADRFPNPRPTFIERVFRNIEGAGAWCDMIQTAGVEKCEEIARLSLDDALHWIKGTWEGPLETLRWGDAHQAVHRHPVLGENRWLAPLVNIRQPVSGGDHTLLRTRIVGAGPEPFLSENGAGYRGVYDLSDPESSVFVISTGQSGHPLSPHYEDLGKLWRRGEYIPMTLNPNLTRTGSVGTTWLLPEE